ncbi:alpha/beta hydrolase family esterase [Pseudomonas schmalbachii]|uniref:Prolyl oligopeptidase family serine peptidase n=1 Tax=Pseudomonas schmalbachii TaxID=2816993 RepID=A0ABS3TWU9_9PSED|nr:alpha/beta fold hydrolase [Pseudomonas schmalbachii]MBO3278165.1 prolyl oligopeptidase family serine peptidase [Pseudomonas schmalbachii]
MRVVIRLLQFFIGALAALLLVGVWWYVPSEMLRRPALTGTSEDSTLRVAGLRRNYVLYVPRQLSENPALLVVLHSARSNGEQMRRDSGYGFDTLADREGFLVLYPDGVGGRWNDCRKASSHDARRRQIDDVRFLSRLIEQVRSERNVDPRRIYVTGYSNGGQMAFRMAAEAPQLLSGIATVAASLPTAQDYSCPPPAQPIAALLMNGTQDPINPYRGGAVTLFGFGDSGRVLSTEQTAMFLARLNGIESEASPERLTTWGPVWSERQLWQAPGTPPVELVSVHGGGHLLPQQGYRPPRLLGRVDPELDGPEVIWRFFSQL